MKRLILPAINQPADLAGLNSNELKQLAAEVRDVIIETVSQNGGHLASNLGVVELTIALLREFNFDVDDKQSDHDVIIFDVGHQSYTYKLLTGRYKDFKGLRKKGGISGFPKRSESKYDFFDTGHSSTSVSVAEGMLRARRARGKGGKVIALIGDGAFGAGMAFEAINDISGDRDGLIVILNDNKMSIDENVGGLSLIFERLRVSEKYIETKDKIFSKLAAMPLIGGPLIKGLRKIKGLDRVLLRKQGLIFEQLGFKYYGPVDGHDFDSLAKHLSAVKKARGPVLLHVLTRKGCGYKFAEKNPAGFHGIAPFRIDTGIPTKKKSPNSNFNDFTYTQKTGAWLCEQAEKDHQIAAISAAMTSGTGLAAFAKKFPERFFDVGIAEQHAAAMAAGLAAEGMKPFLALYSTFLQRASDQIIHDICLQNMPVKILIDHSGFVSQDGETHQGFYDMSILNPLPNIDLFEPIYEEDLYRALEFSLKADHPTAIRYPKDKIPVKADYVPDLEDLYKPRVIKKFSRDMVDKDSLIAAKGINISIAALGFIAINTLEAAELLKRRAIFSDVFLFTASKKQAFNDIIKSLGRNSVLITVEEAALTGGFGESLAANLQTRVSRFTYLNLGVKDLLPEQAGRDELIEEAGLDAEGIADAIEQFINLKRKEGFFDSLA